MLRRQLLPALVLTILAGLVLGIAYPLATYGIGQLAFPHQANGSLIHREGTVVGSELLGQSFSDPAGNPLPGYFQPRPSAAGAGYDGTASGASDLGPGDPRLIGACVPIPVLSSEGRPAMDGNGTPIYRRRADGTLECDPDTVPQRAAAYRTFNGLAEDTPVPVDAVTSSGSGLDPDISAANAALQAPRVAETRGLPLPTVEQLVTDHTTDRALLVLGEKRVNVVQLNLALDALPGR